MMHLILKTLLCITEFSLVYTVENLTVRSGQRANQHHSCHIHQRRWPAAGLALRWPLSSPHTPSWRRRTTGRSGHGELGSEIPHLEHRDTECHFGNSYQVTTYKLWATETLTNCNLNHVHARIYIITKHSRHPHRVLTLFHLCRRKQ